MYSDKNFINELNQACNNRRWDHERGKQQAEVEDDEHCSSIPNCRSNLQQQLQKAVHRAPHSNTAAEEHAAAAAAVARLDGGNTLARCCSRHRGEP